MAIKRKLEETKTEEPVVEKKTEEPVVEKKAKEPVVKKPKNIIYTVNTLLNFRTKPNDKVLFTLTKGTEIEVESVDNGWAKAKVNGQTGYVMEKFISIK